MRAKVALHVSPFEFLKARLERAEVSRRAGQRSRTQLDGEEFTFGLQRGDSGFHGTI